MNKILEMFQSNKEEDGSLDLSIGGCFRCMLCTHNKSKVEHVQLLQISNQILELDGKLKKLELYVILNLYYQNYLEIYFATENYQESYL